MSKSSWVIAVLVLIIVAGGAAWYMQNKTAGTAAVKTATPAAVQTLGTYAYECDEHVAFSMTPSADMSTIYIVPVSGGAYPPVSTLVKKDATSGVRYEGNGVVFTAKGETVTLGEGDSAISCSPTPSQTEAPFNFGD